MNPGRGQRISTQSAFTLVELIMIILVIGVLAAVAVPKFSHTGFELEGAGRRFADDLRYCQELNLIRNGEQWRLGLAADHYCIWRDDNGNGIREAGESYAEQPMDRQDFVVFYNRLRLDGITSSPAVTSLGFTGRGQPDYPGWSYAGVDFVLSRGGSSITLHLESVTGYVY
ncbi:MAG: hypothetical protein JXO49_08840 [Deltaproteobacteria bacterium]|nr:hypothetical protein [Candidatus Anaeroferrophillus wilburensis]MBN2889435.1 hypothetical protein [Deltaproteobacteria bacterium]